MSEISTGGAPAVSVVIPVYNCAAYLPECLDSVIAQTESSWEIICVDDGSTDDSVSVLREYERRLAGKMRVVEQENAGCARSQPRDSLGAGKLAHVLGCRRLLGAALL